MDEEWRDVNGACGKYKVSTFGRVVSFYFNKRTILKQSLNPQGYCFVKLYYKKYEGKTVSVHQLVARHFLKRKSSDTQVNHINGVKTDNSIENLEWCDRSHNMRHAYRTGLNVSVKGADNFNAKLNDFDVLYIRDLKRRNILRTDDLAKLFNVGKTTIRGIVAYTKWSHIP